VVRNVSQVTRMLIRLSIIMRNFRERTGYHILYVADRISNRQDVVVLIVDIIYEERERAEEVVRAILDHLASHNIKVVDYKLASVMMSFKETWRFVAMVAVDHSQ
jgi:hypothetical protein